MNQDFMEKKDIGEMFTACFRKPNEGEMAKTMNCDQLIAMMQKDHSHVPFYEVIPLRVA